MACADVKVLPVRCNYCELDGFDAPDSLGRHVLATHPDKAISRIRPEEADDYRYWWQRR